MANFNAKTVGLFYNTYDQLKEEAERRGMHHESREKTIAKIIWKDAYDAGVIEGKNLAMSRGAICDCPAKPEVYEYCLYDTNDNRKYRLELSEEQARVIEWMIDHEFMINFELSVWEEPFEDVGRI